MAHDMKEAGGLRYRGNKEEESVHFWISSSDEKKSVVASTSQTVGSVLTDTTQAIWNDRSFKVLSPDDRIGDTIEPDDTLILTPQPQKSVRIDKPENKLATLLSTNQVTLLSPNVKAQCALCTNKWKDKNKAYYEFQTTEAIVHEACVDFMAQLVDAHPEYNNRDSFVAFQQEKLENQPGTFRIGVKRAVDLPSVQMLGRQDPYVKAYLLPWNEPVQTKPAVAGGKNPVWNADLDNVFALSHLYNSDLTPLPSLRLELWNANYVTDDLIAKAEINLDPIMKCPNVTLFRWFDLENATKSNSRSRIFLSLVFETSIPGSVASGEHKFRAHSLKSSGIKLTKCPVCDRMIAVGLRSGGYRCEKCSLKVHQSCILQANVRFPCKGTPYDVSSPKTDSPVRKSVRTAHVGIVSAFLHSLHLCSAACTADGHAIDVFEGDTYCRIHLDGRTYETAHVLRSADPVFDVSYEVEVCDRRSSFRLEAIDLKTDDVIGYMEVSLFELLQRDADMTVKHHWLGKLVGNRYHVTIQDRQNIYPLSSDKSSTRVGSVRLTLDYLEHRDVLFLPPRLIRDREDRELSMETIKTNIERLDRIVAAFRDLETWYIDLISWKQPVRSGFVFTIFVYICLFSNAEFTLALLCYALLVYMMDRCFCRFSGLYLKQWIEVDDLDEVKENRDHPYRPIAMLYVAPIEAELESKDEEEATPSQVYVVVKYLPNDTSSDDPSVLYVPTGPSREYEIGQTHAVRASKTRVRWRDLSNVVSKLHGRKSRTTTDAILQNVAISWKHQGNCLCKKCSLGEEGGIDHHAVQYPILQPAMMIAESKYSLLPWHFSPAIITFALVFQSKEENEIAGTAQIDLKTLLQPDRSETIWLSVNALSPYAPTRLCVRVKLKLPSVSQPIRRTDRLYFKFLDHVMKNNRAGLVNTLFDTYRKYREATQLIQNEVGRVCGAIESFQNLLNWTHPEKTAVVFGLILLASILFSFIPGRYIILGVGVSEFGAALREYRPPSNRLKHLLMNSISSLPTTNDLRKAYDGYYQMYCKTQQIEMEEAKKAIGALKFSAFSVGICQTRTEEEKTWKYIFAAVRLNRIVFWKSKDDAEAGLLPIGQVILDQIVEKERGLFQVEGNTGDGWKETRWFMVDESISSIKLAQLMRLQQPN